jgi:SAM-dependent methyltransferase
MRMTPEIISFCLRAKTDFSIKTGRALEIGSRFVNGTIREVFQADAEDYIGVDIEPGECVDFVIDGERIGRHFPAYHFDSVICLECLEHTVHPWKIVKQMRRLLKPSGHLWVSTPTFGFPLHRFPIDCYRFGEDAYRLWIYKGMSLLRIEHITDELEQPIIAAVGRRGY